MYIMTFTGSDDDLRGAIKEAEDEAEHLFDSLGANELFSVTAQTIVNQHGDGTYSGTRSCFHIITVVYE